MFIISDLYIDALGVGYQNGNLNRKAVDEIGRGILRSGKFPGGTNKIHEFLQKNVWWPSRNSDRIPAKYNSEDLSLGRNLIAHINRINGLDTQGGKIVYDRQYFVFKLTVLSWAFTWNLFLKLNVAWSISCMHFFVSAVMDFNKWRSLCFSLIISGKKSNNKVFTNKILQFLYLITQCI